MIHPKIDDSLEKVEGRYALVQIAAKRARQINNYHHQLGEGNLDDFPPPMIESFSKNYLTLALEEVSAGKISTRFPTRPSPVAGQCDARRAATCCSP